MKKIGSYFGDKPPDGSVVNVSPDATIEEEQVIRGNAATNDGRNMYAEPEDSVLNEGTFSQIKDNENPEDYHGAYFPAGGLNGNPSRPNISAIRLWVEKTKVGQNKPQSNWNISEEVGEAFGYIPNGMTVEAERKRVDKIAYLVARKIWYVGRKPAALNDVEWNDMTKNMRPAEGTFHLTGRDEWGGNFPYDETYKYRSGYINE